MNRINNNNNDNIIKENELKNNLNKYKEGSDYSVSPAEENRKKIYTFHNSELRSWFGNSRPVSVREENYKDENLSYWGRFEKGENYTASVQTWNYGSSEYSPYKHSWRFSSIGSGKGEPQRIEPHHFDDFFGNSRDNKIVNHEKNLKRLQERKCQLELELKLRKEKGDSKSGKISFVVWTEQTIKELESKIQYEKAWLVKNANDKLPMCCNCHREFHGSSYYYDKGLDGRYVLCSSDCKEKFIDNNASVNLIKENQDLKKQLAEVKQELVRVSEELKKLKDNLTDKDKEELAREFIEIQEQNDKLINNPKVSAAEIRGHVVKVEDLGKKVNARNVNTETFSTNSPDGKDNSNLLLGGGVTLISILTVGFGYYLVKKKKKQIIFSKFS